MTGSGIPARGGPSRRHAPSAGGEAASTDESAAFAALRARWRDLTLAADIDADIEPYRTRLAELEAQARKLTDTLQPAAGSLWPDAVWTDPGSEKDPRSYAASAAMRTSFDRIGTLARAWAQPGTGLTGDAGLLKAVTGAVDHVCREAYNAAQAPYGNWFDWQIGGPQSLLDALVLLHDHIPAERREAHLAAVDHFVPDSRFEEYRGTTTGANRVNLCRVVALRGVVGGRADRIALARDGLSPVLPHVTAGDGLYEDGSFVQHRIIAYTGTYGESLLNSLGLLLALLAGSTWEVTDPNRQVVLDAVENAWAPVMHDGLVMDAVSGRQVSRGLRSGAPAGPQQEDDHTRGHRIAAAVALLALGATEAERARWQSLVKGWMLRDTWRPLTQSTLDLAQFARVQALLDDEAVPAAPEPRGHRLFPAMDRAVHRGAGWTASLSMSSRRIAFYETGTGDHLRGWHTGSGMLNYWTGEGDGGQYSDHFWPTVDPYRLPGTTVSAKPLADAEGGDWGKVHPRVDWVGGVTDGTYAAVGQHVGGLASTLGARASWFFTDDVVVCLGAGITASDGTTVETVVDNRHLGADGTPALTVDGHRHPGTGTLEGARWAHLAGHAGYLFLDRGARIEALREDRTGAWRDVNRGGSTAEFTRRYQTLVVEHGTDPAGSGYAYVLLPGSSAARTAARSASVHGWLKVLSNTARAQGVWLPRERVTAVNLLAAGSAGPLTADGPCSVLVREHRDGTATVCVADPERSRTTLTVTWQRPVREVVDRPGTVASAATGPALRVTFTDLTGTAGATQRLTVRLG